MPFEWGMAEGWRIAFEQCSWMERQVQVDTVQCSSIERQVPRVGALVDTVQCNSTERLQVLRMGSPVDTGGECSSIEKEVLRTGLLVDTELN
jgi:hypothetical protein